MGGVYFDCIGNFSKAYEQYEKAYNFDRKDSSIVSNFAEANLATERFNVAYDLANEVLSKHNVTNEVKIAMKLLIVVSSAIQKKEYVNKIEDLIAFYKNLSNFNSKSWSNKGMKRFIGSNKELSDKEKNLILDLISVFELSKSGGLTKIKEVEISLNKLKSQ